MLTGELRALLSETVPSGVQKVGWLKSPALAAGIEDDLRETVQE